MRAGRDHNVTVLTGFVNTFQIKSKLRVRALHDKTRTTASVKMSFLPNAPAYRILIFLSSFLRKNCNDHFLLHEVYL